MNLKSRFASYFAADDADDVSADAFSANREVLDWMAQPYHEKFEKWLDDESSKPFPISGDQAGLIQSVVRVNTFREVATYLKRKRATALNAVRQAREEDNG